MIIVGRRSALLLLAGDVAAFALSLYITLLLRYGAVPGAAALAPYLVPFSFLFAVWVLVFYDAGLYGKRLALLPSRMPDILLKAQVVNVFLAALFFFTIPAFGIAPKTILAIYLVVSLAVIYLWRLALYPRFSRPRAREPFALLGGAGEEAEALIREVNGNPRYGIEIVAPLDGASAEHPGAPYQPVPFEDLYEEVFDRVPLSALSEAWMLRYTSAPDPLFYIVIKRMMDIVGGLLMGAVTLLLAPFIWAANRIEGPGPLCIRQERFGARGARITAYKFRSMQRNDAASGQWTTEGDNRITRVGAFLRRTSLDEFPQFINVLKGELSLVGPRNDIKGLGERLAAELPYYEARYLVTPGITGWAQVNQRYEPGNLSPQSVEETRVRLAYDFYYLKHRSFGLDLVIMLKTFSRMFFRMGSW